MMLGRLRTKVAESGVNNVEVVRAGILTHEHVGQPTDFAYSRWALHHLDFWKAVALRRVRSTLRPGRAHSDVADDGRQRWHLPPVELRPGPEVIIRCSTERDPPFT